MADFFADDDYEDYEDDGGGYEYYMITTVDPGTSVLVATLVFCLSLYILLPIMVVFCSRRDESKKKKKRMEILDENKNSDIAIVNKKNPGRGKADEGEESSMEILFLKSMTSSSGCAANSVAAYGSQLDSIEDETSRVSHASIVSSMASYLVGPILDTVKQARPSKKERSRKRTRVAMGRLDAELDEVEGSILYNQTSERKNTTNTGEFFYASDTDEDNHAGTSSGADSLEPQTSSIGHEDVSFHDAVDGINHINKNKNSTDGSDDVDAGGSSACYGMRRKGRKWRRSIGTCYGKLLSIAEWDYETRRIYKLGFPFFLQALLEGVAEIGRLAIIGRLLGTRELAAYVTVDMLISFTAEVLGGFHESLVSLLSHSIGCGNRKLTGQYVQLSMELYIIFSIPFLILWYFLTEDTLLLLGFDHETAKIGKSFAVPYMFYTLLEGVLECIHGLLDVIDLEMMSTVMIVIGEIVATVAVFLAAWFWKPPLETIGFIYLIVIANMLWISSLVIHLMGWFRRYYCGLLWSFAMVNCSAVARMLKTAFYLSAGYLLTYSEWELLTFFVRFLGPAEVAAWGVLGTLWDVLEEITEAIADAAEVRVALLLGAGEPGRAKKSAYKSVLIAFVFSLVSTSCLFIAGDNLSMWLTTDRTLQILINELMPLFGIGNIVLTMGTMAWTIVGAQGRYRLSTAIGCAGSWLVTIPLAAVSTIVLRINLQAQTAAVVIGYMVSGMVTNLVLFRSDWELLSKQVIEFNKEQEYNFSDDESSSSSSSSEEEAKMGPSVDRDINGADLPLKTELENYTEADPSSSTQMEQQNDEASYSSYTQVQQRNNDEANNSSPEEVKQDKSEEFQSDLLNFA